MADINDRRVILAYTDGSSSGGWGPGGYGVVLQGAIYREIAGYNPYTTNQRMELEAACVALEKSPEGSSITIFSDSAYLINCMRQRWYEKWNSNGWRNSQGEPVANRDLWERLLVATDRHHKVLWRKVKGHSKTEGSHKIGNDLADALAVEAKKNGISQEEERTA